MFSKSVSKYSIKIDESDEFKQLTEYHSAKRREANKTLLDWQKEILSGWLLEQLKGGNWRNPNITTILLVAHEVNEIIEREKAEQIKYYVDFASSEDLSETKATLEYKLVSDLKRLKENRHEIPQALSEKKTGLVTVSLLSKNIVNLYDKMQKVLQAEGLASSVSHVSKSESKLSI